MTTALLLSTVAANVGEMQNVISVVSAKAREIRVLGQTVQKVREKIAQENATVKVLLMFVVFAAAMKVLAQAAWIRALAITVPHVRLNPLANFLRKIKTVLEIANQTSWTVRRSVAEAQKLIHVACVAAMVPAVRMEASLAMRVRLATVERYVEAKLSRINAEFVVVMAVRVLAVLTPTHAILIKQQLF